MMRRNLGRAFAICAVAATSSRVSPEKLRREDEATCAGYGFKPEINDFANCLQRESLARCYATPPPPPPCWAYWGYSGRFRGPY
jgi:hypothetical protein